MALTKCPHCGAHISDKAHRCPKCGEIRDVQPTNDTPVVSAPVTPPSTANFTSRGSEPTISQPKNKKTWFIIGGCVAVIVIAILGYILFFNSPKSTPDLTESQSVETLTEVPSVTKEVVEERKFAPDLALFEAEGGRVKELDMSDTFFPTFYMPRPIKFDTDGHWTNYKEMITDENGFFVVVERDSDGKIVVLKKTTDMHDDDAIERDAMDGWKWDIEWQDNHPAKLDLSGHEISQDYDEFIYKDNKLVRVNSLSWELGGDEGYITVYKLRDTESDKYGNWIKRKWMKRTETFNDYAEHYKYLKPTFRGQRHKIVELDSAMVTETRTISYYE